MNSATETGLTHDFYDRIKPRLHARIGREVRLARTVLDLGCGSCDLVRYLAQTYGQNVTGIDIASWSFPRQRKTRTGTRFHCRKQDASSLSFIGDGTADAVVSMWALHEMERAEAVLKAAHRVLRPGGEIFLVDFPRDSLAQKLWNEDYYRPEEARSLLRSVGFESVEVRLIEREQAMWMRGYHPAATTKSKERGQDDAMG